MKALSLIFIVTASFLLGLGFLVWMVRKYYWGPTGLPPKERYKAREGEQETDGH
jgi:nitrate reductase NapE component